MTRVRFHRAIYFPEAVSEAVAVFAGYGDLRISDEDPDYIEVDVRAPDGDPEDALVGAFANYALGASVHAHQQQAG